VPLSFHCFETRTSVSLLALSPIGCSTGSYPDYYLHKVFTDAYKSGEIDRAYGSKGGGPPSYCSTICNILSVAYRRYEGNRQFFDDEESEDECSVEDDGKTRFVRRSVVLKKKFRTSRNSVAFNSMVDCSSQAGRKA
jgi:hypothetical protein